MMEKETVDQRNYGIDALRMLSMFFIVTLHILGHGGVLDNAKVLSTQYEIGWFIKIAAYCAVNCYALISGYVGVDSKFKVSNLLLLWLRVEFYSVIITVLFGVFKPELVSKTLVINSFFPVMSGMYWYFTAYFAMFFFIPILNFVLNKMEKKTLGTILIAICIVFSGAQTLFYRDVFGTQSGYTAWWLLILYFIGGFIKKYDLFGRCRVRYFILAYFGVIAGTWLSRFIIENITLRVLGTSFAEDYLIKYTSPTIVVAALCLLLFFRSIKFKSGCKKIIKMLSPMAFSVYLIHDHPLVRENVIANRFAGYASMAWYQEVLFVFVTALSIYLICSGIDLVRERIFKYLKVKDKMKRLENNPLYPAS